MDVFFVLRHKCVNGDETLICSQRSVHATLAQVMVVIPSPTDENGTTGMERPSKARHQHFECKRLCNIYYKTSSSIIHIMSKTRATRLPFLLR